jgi:hypothetical protein
MIISPDNPAVAVPARTYFVSSASVAPGLWRVKTMAMSGLHQFRFRASPE